MYDITHNILSIGDTVVYPRKTNDGNTLLCIGTILKIDETHSLATLNAYTKPMNEHQLKKIDLNESRKEL